MNPSLTKSTASQEDRPQRPRPHHVREQFNRDMGVTAGHHDAADENHPHQAIARDFFGPGQAVVKNVSREKLQKDNESQRPKDNEREPILRVVLDHHLGVFSLNQTLLAFKRLLVTHEPPAPQAAPRHVALVRDMTKTRPGPVISTPAARRIRPATSRRPRWRHCAAVTPPCGRLRDRLPPQSCRACGIHRRA